MMPGVADLIFLLLAVAFGVFGVWVTFTLMRTFQRIASSFEQLVKQNEERLKR
jgi:hypothetical protein